MRLLPLLLLALLLPAAADAQPGASEGQRSAGRLALTAASNGRWGEADSYAQTADPMAAKIVLWMRLANRSAPATASELIGFITENPDWPLPDALQRRAEQALASEPDDALVLRLFSVNHPRTLLGAQRLADALANAGRSTDATAVARRGWAETPGDPFAEDSFLPRWSQVLTDDDAWARFDRLAFARDFAGAARAAYWEGRALTASGSQSAARSRYEAAATLPVAYYGQLASLALGEDPARLSARIAAAPTPRATAPRAVDFASREMVRAVLTLADLGDTRRARIFLLRIEDLAADGTDRLLAARLANHIGRPDHAVWIARRAGADGDILLAEGWPTPYRPPVQSPEPALIFGITRQESNFDTEAVSSANARGLMQLLPTTAVEVARRLGIPHSLGMLTGDPQHNMRLGAGYLDQMLDRFGGAMPLAAAAYNAGPRRVDEWIATYGDPRNGGIDMLDWIELIPISETRNYVQRVTENVLVYRARDPSAATTEHPLTRYLRQSP